MRKNKKKLIQHTEFNSYAQAKDMVDTSKRRVTRIFIGLIIAAIASSLTAYACFGNPADPIRFYLFAFLLSIPAYIIGGGFGKALRAAKSLAVFGWFVVPIFPVDLLLLLFTLPLALFCFFLVPVVFVFLNYIQNNTDYREAKKYLSYFNSSAEGGDQK